MLDESGSKHLSLMLVENLNCGGTNKVNKLENVKVGLRIFNIFKSSAHVHLNTSEALALARLNPGYSNILGCLSHPSPLPTPRPPRTPCLRLCYRTSAIGIAVRWTGFTSDMLVHITHSNLRKEDREDPGKCQVLNAAPFNFYFTVCQP